MYRDFYSDLNLTIEILTRDDLFEDLLILVSGFGSGFFVLVPYIANLIIASRIKEIIKHNTAAKAWFQYHTPVFTLLVVLSGGCHAALSVVSSNVFGLKILSSGVTQYELKQLGKIRIIGTVLVENIPQLICQGLYTVALSRSGQIITSAVQAAFIASALSIISSSLSYLIERDGPDTKAVQYYVSTQCSLRTQKNGNNMNDELGNDEQFGIKRSSSTLSKKEEEIADLLNVSLSNKQGITEEEKQKLLNNRGRTQALGESIAEVFGIPTKNIEVGHSMVTKYGIITHLVHYVYAEDLEIMEEELLNENEKDAIVTPKFFVAQLFIAAKNDIKCVFCQHFMLNNDFEVEFHHRLGIKGRTLRENNNADSQVHNQKPELSKRKTLLKRVTSQVAGNVLKSQDEIKMKLIQDVQLYCNKFAIIDKLEQDEFIEEIRGSMHVIQEINKKELEGDDDINQTAELENVIATDDATLNIEMEPLNQYVSTDL